jgi:hypothetical protein
MKQKSQADHTLLLVVVGLMAWVIPGGGHFIIKERKRAIIIFVTVLVTFLLGLHIGSIGIINKGGAFAWYLAQMMVSPLVAIIGVLGQSDGGRVVYGKPEAYGQIYTAVAGMLNLLSVLSAVYMAHSGRGEMIGTEEDNAA